MRKIAVFVILMGVLGTKLSFANDRFTCEEFTALFTQVLEKIDTPERENFNNILVDALRDSLFQGQSLFETVPERDCLLSQPNFCKTISPYLSKNQTQFFVQLSQNLIRRLDKYGSFEVLNGSVGGGTQVHSQTQIKNEELSITHKILNGNILYIKIKFFLNRETIIYMQDLLSQYNFDHFKKIIIDVRDNPGGNAKDVADFLDFFLEQNLPIMTFNVRYQRKPIVLKSSQPQVIKNPICVLMNRKSMSGAEVVASALQEYRGAVLLGERTFGKIEVQQLYPLQSGFHINFDASIKFTVGAYTIGSGRLATEIRPDIQLENADLPIEDLLAYIA